MPTTLVVMKSPAPVIDRSTWDAQVSALLGDGLLADTPGQAILVRGEVDGVEWALPSSWATPLHIVGDPSMSDPGPAYCVIVEGGHRACVGRGSAGTSAAGAVYDRYTSTDGTGDLPVFAVGITVGEVAAVRASVDGAERIIETVPIPGSDRRAWAIGSRPDAAVGDVVLLDAAGNVVGP